MAEDGEDGRPRRKRHPMLDVRAPFFLPLWRRIATVGVVAAWLAIEIWAGSPWWGLLAAGIGAYLVYEFFIRFDPRDFAPPEDGGKS